MTLFDGIKDKDINIGNVESIRPNVGSVNMDRGIDRVENITTSKDLNCIYANVRSILNKNKREEISLLLKEGRTDILALTESWTHEGVSDAELNFEGFTLFRRDRRCTDRIKGGGLLLYCRNDIKVVRVFDEGDSKCESLWVKVFDSFNEGIFIGLFYRSPSASQEETFDILKQLKVHARGNTVILGDFNFPEINWGLRDAAGVAKEFLKVADDLFLLQLVKVPTRGMNILDLILSTERNLVSDVDVSCPISNSDHNKIAFKVNCETKCLEEESIKYNYEKANFSAIQGELNKIEWSKLFDSKSTNEIWRLFKNILMDNRDSYVPKSKSTGSTKGKSAKWMTKKIKKSIKCRNKAWSRFNENPQINKLTKYRNLRNKVTKEIRKAKRNFEEDLANKIKLAPKAFYAYVSSKTRVRDKVGPLVDENGKTTEDKKEMCEILNRYFASVFTVEDQDDQSSSSIAERQIFDSVPFLDNIVLSDEKILQVINKLKPSKNGGADEVNSSFLLGIAQAIVVPLLLIFKKSLESGEIPDDWRKANVTPIFKKGSRKKPENYRPVSLTSNICKIFERLIANELTKHLDDNSLINKSQHGFRKNKSCLTNLLETTQEISQILDTGYQMDIIYLDFQKAFDKVSHSKLKIKLMNKNVNGRLLSWIMSWLRNRKQRVVVNGETSSWTSVKSGVPQGSVLGPLLFTIFIDDLDEGLSNSVKKFADDTKLFGRASTEDQVNSIREDLDKLQVWADKWHMKFNIEKCKVMHLGSNNRSCKYEMEGKVLQVVREEKDLGIYFENNFKVGNHCLSAAKKGNQILGMIARAFTCKNKTIMKKLFKSLVRPHLEYSIQAWRPHLVKDKKVLEKVQRRATRMVKECKGMNYKERLNFLGLTTLETRRERADMLEVYKILHGLEGVQEKDFFTRDLSNRRGHSFKLFIKRYRMDISKYSFGNRVCNSWNKLPDDVVSAPSVNVFKNKLDRYLRLNGD